jgi:hypothetical protein
LELRGGFLDGSGFLGQLRGRHGILRFDSDFNSLCATLALLVMLIVGGKRLRHPGVSSKIRSPSAPHNVIGGLPTGRSSIGGSSCRGSYDHVGLQEASGAPVKTASRMSQHHELCW